MKFQFCRSFPCFALRHKNSICIQVPESDVKRAINKKENVQYVSWGKSVSIAVLKFGFTLPHPIWKFVLFLNISNRFSNFKLYNIILFHTLIFSLYYATFFIVSRFSQTFCIETRNCSSDTGLKLILTDFAAAETVLNECHEFVKNIIL